MLHFRARTVAAGDELMQVKNGQVDFIDQFDL